MKTILLSGFKKSGKDTSADYIIDKFRKKGLKVEKFALANRLKNTCAQACRDVIDASNKLKTPIEELRADPLNWTSDQDLKEENFSVPFELSEAKLAQICKSFSVGTELSRKHIGKQLKSMREVLQFVGTEVLRDYGQDIHCESLQKELHQHKDLDYAIITDCRFLNERMFFDESPAYFVSRPQVEPELTPELHRSEAEMFEVKKLTNMHHIDNSGKLKDLHAQLDEIIRKTLL